MGATKKLLIDISEALGIEDTMDPEVKREYYRLTENAKRIQDRLDCPRFDNELTY